MTYLSDNICKRASPSASPNLTWCPLCESVMINKCWMAPSDLWNDCVEATKRLAGAGVSLTCRHGPRQMGSSGAEVVFCPISEVGTGPAATGMSRGVVKEVGRKGRFGEGQDGGAVSA